MSEDQAVTGADAPSRRALLLGAGAVGATVALGGCGTGNDKDLGDGGGTGSPQSASGSPQGGGSNPGAAPLAKKGEIPVGGGKIFAKEGVVVTQPTAGEFKGFSNICTHQGCPVSSIDAGTITCTCHFSKFSIEDGSVKGGPAKRPLPAKDVKVEGDNIVLA
ncbi:Rieske (2Fe-2S) protein [Micromonospora sp. NPDC049679]|uniref:Rieske (2Fe-2S) protein n=1 Tax=Micromonospora sp. NPDC049679 TaxID=3155920 RepID=UPI0033FF12DF